MSSVTKVFAQIFYVLLLLSIVTCQFSSLREAYAGMFQDSKTEPVQKYVDMLQSRNIQFYPAVLTTSPQKMAFDLLRRGVPKQAIDSFLTEPFYQPDGKIYSIIISGTLSNNHLKNAHRYNLIIFGKQSASNVVNLVVLYQSIQFSIKGNVDLQLFDDISKNAISIMAYNQLKDAKDNGKWPTPF